MDRGRFLRTCLLVHGHELCLRDFEVVVELLLTGLFAPASSISFFLLLVFLFSSERLDTLRSRLRFFPSDDPELRRSRLCVLFYFCIFLWRPPSSSPLPQLLDRLRLGLVDPPCVL